MADGGDVVLNWMLPNNEDVDFVRIVRSHLSYPLSPTDGAIVYQGLGTGVIEDGILNSYPAVFYTAFLYDERGNISSGALALVFREDQDGLLSEISREVIELNPVSEAEFEINEDRLTPTMKMPEPNEITVEQDDRLYTMEEAPLLFDTETDILVSIPTRFIAGNLKSIIASITDPSDNRQTYSYLLRLNRAESAYEAVLANPALTGKSQLRVAIYDYEAYVVATYQTPVSFEVPRGVGGSPEINSMRYRLPLYLLGAVLGGVTFLIWLLVRRSRSEDNQ
jgi:hypothetical protein